MAQMVPVAGPSQARAALERWGSDPVLFAHEVLGIKTWSRQAEILRAVARHKRVAVKSGHKVSKTTSAVILALWFAITRREGRVIMTAASGRQVREVFWRELLLRYHRARVPLGGTPHETPAGGIRFGGGREILGFSTDESEKMAGFSGENLLYLLDEASGIARPIFDAVEGNRAGGARLAMFSNPTQTSGEFFDAFHDKRALYDTHTISSEESPNVVEGRDVIPGLATREWIEEKKIEWGVDSPLYDVRVKGKFPSQGTNAVIGLSLIEAALARYASTKADGPLELGVDPARFGDDESTIVARRGLKVLSIEAYQGLDGPALASKVAHTAKRHARAGEKPRVKIDSIGVGASPYDCLKAMKDLEVVAVDAGRTASSGDYVRLRDQLWFGCRDWLAGGGALPKDSKLEGELAAPTYSLDARNRMKVESKDDIRKRLKRSPDRADALCLSVFSPAPGPRDFPKPHLYDFENAPIG